MSNCKHCGAPQADSREFECGTKTYANIRGESCYEAEIEKLRDKKAEGLTWEATGGDHEAASPSGSFVICMYPSHYRLIVNGTPEQRFKTIDAAKAHAEELHQAAFAEFNKKWGRK